MQNYGSHIALNPDELTIATFLYPINSQENLISTQVTLICAHLNSTEQHRDNGY